MSPGSWGATQGDFRLVTHQALMARVHTEGEAGWPVFCALQANVHVNGDYFYQIQISDILITLSSFLLDRAGKRGRPSTRPWTEAHDPAEYIVIHIGVGFAIEENVPELHTNRLVFNEE